MRLLKPDYFRSTLREESVVWLYIVVFSCKTQVLVINPYSEIKTEGTYKWIKIYYLKCDGMKNSDTGTIKDPYIRHHNNTWKREIKLRLYEC